MFARRRGLLIAAGLALLVPNGVRSQLLTGTVVDELTGAPVQAVLVEILGSEGERLHATLSGADGEWIFRLPAPGLYGARLSRLGYRTVALGPWQVGAAGRAVDSTSLTPEPIRLASLTAQGSARCVVNPANAPMTALLWDQAAKSLEVAALVNEQELVRYEVAWFRRTLEPDRRALVEEELAVRLLSRPFWSPPPAELLAQGFVREGDDSVTYYMPHPTVVLSREFLDNHCFHIARRSGPEGRFVGLAFEPLATAEGAEVAGTLWLEEATGGLTSLEYDYVGFEDEEGEAVAGGAAEFEQLRSGLWVVRRWFIRAPLLGGSAKLLGLVQRTDVRGIVEEGGELLQAADREGHVVTRVHAGVLSGMVFDSLQGLPLPGAQVRLVGTTHAATSGADGTFRMEGLPAGAYVATFYHPILDTLSIHWPVRDVRVPAGEDPLFLAVPSPEGALRRACPGLERGRSPEPVGVVSGHVFDAETGEPLPGVTVAVSTGGRFSRSGSGRTDGRGFFRVCGVPPGVWLEVEAMDDRGRSAHATLRLSPMGFARIDLVMAYNNPSPNNHPMISR